MATSPQQASFCKTLMATAGVPFEQHALITLPLAHKPLKI
jgi:hypothetical protein